MLILEVDEFQQLNKETVIIFLIKLTMERYVTKFKYCANCVLQFGSDLNYIFKSTKVFTFYSKFNTAYFPQMILGVL